MNRRMWRLPVAVATVVTVSSCASLNVSSLPAPGSSYRGGYDIVIEFANALNLPDSAKVVLDGTTVGVVAKVALSSDAVDVTSTIDRNVCSRTRSWATSMSPWSDRKPMRQRHPR
jgi:ABC-type transporter Mla subunit MlaD